MKKEIFAGLFLLAMLTVLLINIGQLSSLCDKVSSSVQESGRNAAADNWEQAALQAEKALDDWLEKDPYTHVVLRHSEINAITDLLYDLLEATYNEEAGSVACISRKTVTQLQSLSSIERVRLGSIF